MDVEIDRLRLYVKNLRSSTYESIDPTSRRYELSIDPTQRRYELLGNRQLCNGNSMYEGECHTSCLVWLAGRSFDLVITLYDDRHLAISVLETSGERHSRPLQRPRSHRLDPSQYIFQDNSSMDASTTE